MAKLFKPLLKYPGGKGRELKVINENLPQSFHNYIEPFVGGGAVYWDIEALKYFINDISVDLMLLYEYVKNQDKIFFNELKLIDENWQKLKYICDIHFEDLSNKYYSYKNETYTPQELKTKINEFVDSLSNCFNVPLFTFNGFDDSIFRKQLKVNLYGKMLRIKNNERKNKRDLQSDELKDNIECSIKSAYYMHFREIYNNLNQTHNINPQRRVAIFLFIREYCFSSMFRFNSNGYFNVPYGGISYNNKNMASKIEHYKETHVVDKLKNTILYKLDFENFLKQIKIQPNDFMFLDPPYDTEFSEYDKNKFGQEEQKRLANYLIKECPCKFMIVIKQTKYIESLYKNKGLNIQYIDKNYSVSFMDRNDKEVVHLIITNYEKGEVE